LFAANRERRQGRERGRVHTNIRAGFSNKSSAIPGISVIFHRSTKIQLRQKIGIKG